MNINALPQTAAATLLSTTPRTLRDWEKAGEGIPRNPDGSYPGPALVAWFAVRQTGAKLDPLAERARKDKESADKLALENAQTRSEVGLVSDMEEWFGGHVERAQKRLIQIPDELGQFCDQRTAPTVVGEARRLIYEALAELAGDGAQGSAEGVAPVVAAADADSQRVGGPAPKAVKRKQRRAGAVAN